MATTIVLTNQKGGVGKTTTTASLSAGLSKLGKRVLSIDLDPQGNLGFSLGIDIENGPTVHEVLKGELSIGEAIHSTEEYGDILTSNILLSDSELLFQGEDRRVILKNALKTVDKYYDFIIIDTPPALNILTINGYVAADYLIIPMASEILSLVGLIQLKETVEEIRESVNVHLNVLGILLTRYNKRTNLSRDVEEMANTVAKQIGTTLFDAKIRTGVKVAEAPAHGKTALDYATSSNSSKDYQEFVSEVVKKLNII